MLDGRIKVWTNGMEYRKCGIPVLWQTGKRDRQTERKMDGRTDGQTNSGADDQSSFYMQNFVVSFQLLFWQRYLHFSPEGKVQGIYVLDPTMIVVRRCVYGCTSTSRSEREVGHVTSKLEMCLVVGLKRAVIKVVLWTARVFNRAVETHFKKSRFLKFFLKLKNLKS